MFYVYILKLNNGENYIGFSTHLRSRIKNHKKGKVNATKKYLPCKLVFYAAFRSQDKAIKFEDYLKTSSGFAFRNKRLI